MEFKEFRNMISDHFKTMTKDVDRLFEAGVDKDEMWNVYLDSFPAGTNEIYRKRREYDCSCCRQFIKQIGNAVVIKDNKLETIWDLDIHDDKFEPVAKAMSNFVRRHCVTDVYVSKFKKIGTEYNYEQYEDGTMKKWEHFQIILDDKFVDKTARSIGDIKGGFRDTKNVFKRSLDEISMDALETVLELINSNTLYKGEEWKSILMEFKRYKKEYEKLNSDDDRDLYSWENSVKAGIAIGRIRNHSIGTFLVNVSNDMDLDTAVKKYEQIVAPANYKRPKAIFTKKMLEDAKKTISELGYMDSLNRRFATLDDITVNNILFSNKDAAKRISDSSDIFGELEKQVVVNPRKFSRIEEISANDFIKNVLPSAKEVEVLVENKHSNNFVSLIAPCNKDSKSMFKWNNGLSWAYSGNITDSDMKQNVKAAGGNVDGVLRFSIQWNEDGRDNCDLDAHCIEPNRNEIYFSNCRKPSLSSMTGQLDVDIIHPNGKVAVENITWSDKSKMKPGVYKFFVNQYSGSARNGFRAEIEFNGEIHSFDYSNSMMAGQDVHVADAILDTNGEFTIKEKISGNSKISSKTVWGISTNEFTPVSVVCYSPNYFDEQDGIGHRHLFFMLNGCKNDEEPNGYYNEFLKSELEKHKRVFEALGSKCHVEYSNDQLSGVGFSMTKRAELIVKVKGATERILKIKF
ncbi:hypothetical protein HMPREF0991_02698 [Lachnospiraceae bacterium 2_1_58FAA]|uniref:hypothetical protein n=1 Tax=Mediterraneibacter gnavus TaxID=33038 RepID=UPI0002135799|nr:hypothetical protein [Mediterraneibacter gnavus]EGN45295.1 hypothetical protein HMPREF0991_02698 [Lachnospiraceae bacterium 2_1_58FAA]